MFSLPELVLQYPALGTMGDGTDAHISELCGCSVYVGDVIRFMNNNWWRTHKWSSAIFTGQQSWQLMDIHH
jgi:hypothetical protein